MIEVPENTLAVLPHHESFARFARDLVVPMAGQKRRDWFIQHAYFCLPLVIGNQYGFGLRSSATFEAVWHGGWRKEDVEVTILEQDKNEYGDVPQYISSHFGMGTVTIQNRFSFHTPAGVNLMTINPPNHWIDGVQHMTGVIETDNLRRDFTFNLKLTRPGHTVRVNKGDYIGCVLPIPRYFPDSFAMKLTDELFTPEQVAEEIAQGDKFAMERATTDLEKPHRNGRRYFNGEDADGNKFPDHQKHVKRHDQ